MSKLCKDCKFMKNPGPFAQCTSPNTSAAKIDANTGFQSSAVAYCGLERSYADECGPDGKWFQPTVPAQPEAASGACEVTR